MQLIYDIDRKVFRSTSGTVRTSFRPSISYGERTSWQIEIQATDAGEVSLGGATAWRSAIDQDFNSSTEPMARTTSGITMDTTGDWPVATVAIDTLTERFRSVCDGRQTTPVYFELAGLDASGDTVFYICFAIDALFPIDPAAAGTLTPVNVTTMTESQVEAIAAAAGAAAAEDAAKAAASEVSAELAEHAADTAIHVPADGTAGQVLTKTDTGTEWKDASSGSASVDLSDYYTKEEVSNLVSSETTTIADDVSALDTRVTALEESADDSTAYTLPAATASTLGGVKVGSGLAVTEDGTLSATVSDEAAWGSISGTLSDQTDLASALAAKADASATTTAQETASAAQTAAASAQASADALDTKLDTHAADTAIHVPSDGTAGQVLTKTDTGLSWKDSSAALGTYQNIITEFNTTSREWTEDDVGKLFLYTGVSTGMFFKGRIYQGIRWQTAVSDYSDNVVNPGSTDSDDSSDTDGDSATTTVSYVVVATNELAKYSGTYTLSSGSDGSTDAIYTGDNGMYMFYGKHSSTDCWVCSATVSQGAQPTDNVYIYATGDITGTWYSSDSDYAGNVTSVTRQETTSDDASTVNAASTTASDTTITSEYPDWPLTFKITGPITNASTGTAYGTGTTIYQRYAQALGTYYRTGDTFTDTSNGEEVPIWTNGTCYIHAYTAEGTEPFIALFIPTLGSTYTPSYSNTWASASLVRAKSYVTRPEGTPMAGTPSTVTITTEDSSDGAISRDNGDCWSSVTASFDITIQETYYVPPLETPGSVILWEYHYGCSIVTLGASRDWTDEHVGVYDTDTTGNSKPGTLTCYPGGRYFTTVDADNPRTIYAGSYSGPPLAECDLVINLAVGASVTLDSSITLRGTMTAGQLNFCRLVWVTTSAATLIVQ